MSKAADILINRIRQRLRRLEPDSPELNRAMTRIGIKIHRSAAQHMDQKLRRITGNLATNLRWRHRRDGDKQSVEVGVWTVPYAAIHEFGGVISRNSKKGLLHTATYPKRAYLKPAFDDNIDDVMKILRKTFDV